MRVSVTRACEEIFSILQPRFESIYHLAADFITTRGGGGTNRNTQIRCTHSIFPHHSFNCMHHDSGESAAPARMHGGERSSVCIADQNWNAVSGLYCR